MSAVASPPPEGGSAEAAVASSMTRVVSSLQTTTLNGVLAVSSSIVDITPHLAGAIDVIAVRQPDGSLKCTPFYARFGKFVERWSQDKTVKVYINGEEMTFGMHLGRTGEAFFLEQTEDGDECASANSGSSTPAEADATPGATIEHVVAARETAQALERLDSAEVAPAEASPAASQLMARAASEVLQLRAQPASPAAATDAAPAEQPAQPDVAAATPEQRHAQQGNETASSPADAVAPYGRLPAPDAAATLSGSGDRPCLSAIRTRPAANDGSMSSSTSAGTGPNTPDIEAAAVPTALSAARHLRRAISGNSESSDGEPAVGSDAGTDSASPAAEAAQLQLPPASRALAGLADAELSLSATAIYYADSPAEVWSEFESARVPWEDYAERPEEFLADPELTIRIGEDIMPWREAEAYVAGLLFYGASAAAAPKPTARITVARPLAASVAAVELGEGDGADSARARDAADSDEEANKSAGHQDGADESDYEDAEDAIGPHETEDADIVSAAPSAVSASDDACDSTPPAAMAPAAVIDAPDAAGEGDITSGTETDTAPAEQPAALAPAFSPAVPGAWAALADFRHARWRAAEDGTDTGDGLAEGGKPALLPDAQLSLSGDRLQDDATPDEARDVFDAGVVREDEFRDDGPAIVRSANLLCRVGGSVYRWRHAVPALAGRLAYPLMPWRRLFRRGIRALGPADAPDSHSAQPQEGSPGRSWGSWLPPWRSPPRQQGDSMQPASDMGASAEPDAVPAGQRPRRMQRSFVPSAEELSAMQLNDGQNEICFRVGRECQRAYVHVVPWNARLVVSDVDGTITKSDVLGHILPMVTGHHWSHSGITRLYKDIKANGYHFIFLSSRSIGQASLTRDYLHRLNVDGHQLPLGPVIISPDGLIPSLYREMVVKRPYEFKIRCLKDIRALFPECRNPFHAGFGNRHTDERSYRAVGIPDVNIFTINKSGELRRSTHAAVPMSLASINELTPYVFPPHTPLRVGKAALLRPPAPCSRAQL